VSNIVAPDLFDSVGEGPETALLMQSTAPDLGEENVFPSPVWLLVAMTSHTAQITFKSTTI
jgi:hypothetical protein